MFFSNTIRATEDNAVILMKNIISIAVTIIDNKMIYLCFNKHKYGISQQFLYPSAERESEHFDMDYSPVSTTKWTDIPSVRTYHDVFEANAGEFRKG